MFNHLAAEAERLKTVSLQQLMQQDRQRAQDFALRVGPLYANFARQHYDRKALDTLFKLADKAGLGEAMQRLVDGEKVNISEHRAALHTALRGDISAAQAAQAAHREAQVALARMQALVESIHADERITDVVSIGIGGSDLGPRMVVDALQQTHARLRVHFVSNIDAVAITRVLAGLRPENTIGIVISKSFGTQETLLNGRILRNWLNDDERLYAVSANPVRAADEFGIAPASILPMWDWVGGRYSLWSAVGFPVALALGMPAFLELLKGASAFDTHALSAPVTKNLAMRHALTAVWNRQAMGATTQAVMPYDQRLALMPAYLQQLTMESLGKCVRCDGRPVEVNTSPVWWGGVGSDCQHSFFQALHQGSEIVPCDFIGVVCPGHSFDKNHQLLLSNLLAQSQALANGKACADPHRAYPGGRPSTLLLLDRLDAFALGHLLALYEHSVYLQAVLWGINAFDQFGVELGKQVATALLPALRGESPAEDAVTAALIAQIQEIDS
ncbi:glucose-6-phosphate isomerase [Lysobacteraceae bacterium NML95-0200]|nr:glucose-6-phosphate isomerase [Xanthomonadaceae bacterium NML95-0200]